MLRVGAVMAQALVVLRMERRIRSRCRRVVAPVRAPDFCQGDARVPGFRLRLERRRGTRGGVSTGVGKSLEVVAPEFDAISITMRAARQAFSDELEISGARAGRCHAACH